LTKSNFSTYTGIFAHNHSDAAGLTVTLGFYDIIGYENAFERLRLKFTLGTIPLFFESPIISFERDGAHFVFCCFGFRVTYQSCFITFFESPIIFDEELQSV
jgi:hypothetical protein